LVPKPICLRRKNYKILKKCFLLLSGCVVNKQCRKITPTERSLSNELCNSFVSYRIATFYKNEINEEQQVIMILSHEEFVDIFIINYGIDTYNDIDDMYYEEVIRRITLYLIEAIQRKDLIKILQTKNVYAIYVADPVYIVETTKNLNKDFSNFDLDELKEEHVKLWKSLAKK
jgi:hypothetical protein